MEHAEAHRRTKLRKHRKRLITLLVVLGSLCLVIGVLFELASLTHPEHARGGFIRLGLYYLAAGAVLLLIQLLFFRLPDYLAERRSGVVRRRRENARLYHRPKPSPVSPVRADDGSILVIVLVLLGFVAAAALHATVTARSELRLASVRLEHALLRVAAIDTARAAMQQLADDPDLAVDHLGENWAGSREYLDPAGMTRMIQVNDAQRGFDLNNLAVPTLDQALSPPEILANIMIQCGEMTPGQRIQSLQDWIDADAAGPWEKNFYAEKDPPSAIANRLLYGWSETFLAEGWTPALMAPKSLLSLGRPFQGNLGDGVTVVPVPRQRALPLNINTASPVALNGVFGIGREGIVERIMTARKEAPLRDIAFLAGLLGDAEFSATAPYLDVKSRYFHIQATAYRDGRMARLDLIARRTEDGRVDAVQAMF